MRKLAHWLEEYTAGESIDLLTDLASHVLDKGPLTAQFAWAPTAVRRREYRRICEFVLDYADATLTVAEAKVVRQVQALFQKATFLDVGIDREAVGRLKYEEAELLCRKTNEIFRQWKKGRFVFKPTVEAVFHRASRIVSEVLGDVPTIEQLGLRFGPGASTRVKKRHASIKRKLSAEVSCSEELIPWAARLLAELPHITDLNYTVRTIEYHQPTGIKLDVWSSVPVLVEQGAVSFVVKNYGAFRPVETQPSLNGLLQLGYGDEMSKRCYRSGLDLTDQSLNRELAKWGSLTGALATLDLSSASDTIAIELVAHLLPVDWFSALLAARVGKTTVPWQKEPVVLEKFSAMGNGYTFPLESLIFWALSRAVTETVQIQKTSKRYDGYRNDPASGQGVVSVYGDDIIVAVECVPLLIEVLTASGFLVNAKKSYWQGPFRESCGADYFRGIDIRPVYVKDILTPAGLFALHNGLYRRGERDAADYVRKALHPCLCLEGPDGYGDGHLLSESWVGRPYKRHLGYEGVVFDTFSRIPKRDNQALQPGERILPHYSIYRRGASPLVPKVEGVHVSKLRGPRPKDGSKPMYVEVNEPSIDLPLVKDADGNETRAVTFPGDEGYKKTSIYTLVRANPSVLIPPTDTSEASSGVADYRKRLKDEVEQATHRFFEGEIPRLD